MDWPSTCRRCTVRKIAALQGATLTSKSGCSQSFQKKRSRPQISLRIVLSHLQTFDTKCQAISRDVVLDNDEEILGRRQSIPQQHTMSYHVNTLPRRGEKVETSGPGHAKDAKDAKKEMPQEKRTQGKRVRAWVRTRSKGSWQSSLRADALCHSSRTLAPHNHCRSGRWAKSQLWSPTELPLTCSTCKPKNLALHNSPAWL